MKAPRFWQKRGFLAQLLRPVGALYGFITLWRMQKRGFKAAIPVFCVGNVTLGGTGKTPVVLAIFDILQEMGVKSVVLTRGYGGKITKATLAVGQGAHELGDEAKLLALHAPVIVAPNRAEGAKLAQKLGFACILMDDGFQNPQLHKDFSFLVFDRAGLGNGLVFPAGELRAPLLPQLMQAQAIIMTGEGNFVPNTALPLLLTRALAQSGLARETKLLAFCGLGKPEKFFKTLQNLGFRDVETVTFSDHHAYSAQEIAALKAQAKNKGRRLITTAKDAVKWPEPIAVVDFKLEFEDKAALKAMFAPFFTP